MHKLLDYVCGELEELERKSDKGKLSMSEIEYADKLAHLKKNILRADELMDEGYSGDSHEGSYANRIYDGGSYARGRGVKRDSMGRYSSDRGYSRRYAMDNASMVDELKDLMNEAPDERTRQEFERFIKKMEQM